MALFRDEKEALQRLENALQDEESPEEAYEDSDEAYEEECEEDDGYVEGFAPDAARIRIRNTDRTDLDPEDLTEVLHKRKPGFWVTILILLSIAALFLALTWFVQQYM